MWETIKSFEIHLDHDIDEQYQYEPGEELTGKIILSLAEDISVKSIKVQVKGEAMVSFEDESRKSNEPLTASEIYVDATLTILENTECISMKKGDHSFPFKYILPSNLPSSFLGKYGNITYIAKATLRQGHENKVGIGSTITSEPFMVLRKFDLKPYTELFKPSKSSIIKSSKCAFFCCRNSRLEAEFVVSRTGFLPNEDIIINAQITNNYLEDIISTQAILVLKSCFHAKDQLKPYNQIVNTKIDDLPIENGSYREWTDLRLQIPPFIPESKLDGCVLIDIQYTLQLKMIFEDNDEILTSIPIVIGTPTNSKQGGQTWNEKNYPISNVENFEFVENEFEKFDINVDIKDLEKFRHPMFEGETKENLLFQDD